MKTILILIILLTISDNIDCQCVRGSMPNTIRLFERYDPEVDQILIKHINDLEDIFNLSVEVFYYDDHNSPNAIAICNPYFDKLTDGTITYGIGMIEQIFFTKEHYHNTIIAILAHEFAHIYQCVHNCDLYNDKKELQADFLAGWYAGSFPVFDCYDALEMFFELGDFHNPYHHGSKVERQYIFAMGYRYSGLPLKEAYNKSFKIINELVSHTNELIFILCPRCDNSGEGLGILNDSACWLCGGTGVLPTTKTEFTSNNSRQNRGYIITTGKVKNIDNYLDYGCCIGIDN